MGHQFRRRRKRGNGAGYPLPISNYGVWRSVVSSHGGVLGRAPAENDFM